jgi:tRNA A-37 threonylcarbamoyl transferase component Bud32
MEEQLKGGRYKIEKEIGSGGMGVVYRARDTRLKCSVALKEIRTEHLNDAQYRRRLAQEAHAAAAISHPGIARAYDFVDSAQESFIVYEFVEGITLRDLLVRKRFTTEEILDVGIKVADALAAAHAQGFTHRDLKPENLMLTPRPDGTSRVKILDFGLAKRHRLLSLPQQDSGAETETGSITTPSMVLIGTINYMSPEQLGDTRQQPVDARSDIYALGLILYEMATGINPFRGETVTSTITNIVTREAPPIQERNAVAPPELDEIIRKCLRKRREERPQSAGELVTALSDLRRRLAAEEPSAVRKVDEHALPAPEPLIPRQLARSLFVLIQAGYLIMYGLAFFYLPENVHRLPMVLPVRTWALFVPIALSVLCAAAAVRLYLLSAVAFDYADLGRLFRRAFPGILVLDLGFALFPLLLFYKLGYVTLLCLIALVFLPFSQRTLAYSAYGPRGGRSSAAPTAGTSQARRT